MVNLAASMPWDMDAKIIIHHGRKPREWAGTLADCLNVWLRLSVAAQRNADIFVQRPLLGESAIGPAMIADLIALPDFQKRPLP